MLFLATSEGCMCMWVCACAYCFHSRGHDIWEFGEHEITSNLIRCVVWSKSPPPVIDNFIHRWGYMPQYGGFYLIKGINTRDITSHLLIPSPEPHSRSSYSTGEVWNMKNGNRKHCFVSFSLVMFVFVAFMMTLLTSATVWCRKGIKYEVASLSIVYTRYILA